MTPSRASVPFALLSLLWVAVATTACGGGGGTVAPPTDDPDPQPDLPLVLFDGGHENFHRISTNLAPLAIMLSNAGWAAREHMGAFTSQSLAEARVLIISNALHPTNVDDWFNPVAPAFTQDEVAAVRSWVEGGGALLLIADHMPFPAAAAPLAAAFGVEFTNGFALDTAVIKEPSTCLLPNQIHMFRRSDGTMTDHAVTRAQGDAPAVDSVGTFTGQAFKIPTGAVPLLVFNGTSVSLFPDTAWVFHEATPTEDVSGWVQGALLQVGSGRAAFFGEAAMFTEQTCGGGARMGWNHPRTTQNRALALNVVRWLSGGAP